MKPVSPEDPCGPDLSDTPEYGAFLGEVARASRLSDSVGDATGADLVREEEASWKIVSEAAVKLLEKSKDVWLVVNLAKARARLKGLSHFADVLELLKGMLEAWWVPLHPHQDPDDDYPIQRINQLSELSSLQTARLLWRVPVFGGARGATYTILDTLVVSGNTPSGISPRPGLDMAAVRGAATASGGGTDAVSVGDTLRRCVAALEGISASVSERSGQSGLLDFGDLCRTLSAPLLVLESAGLSGSGGSAGATGAGPTPDGLTPGQQKEGVMSDGNGGATGPNGEIRSREDVLRAIDRICAFYQSFDRSSAVPALLSRVKRLVTMDFLESVKELYPDAYDAMRKSMGVPAEESGTSDNTTLE